jgi:hypothetical protein
LSTCFPMTYTHKEPDGPNDPSGCFPGKKRLTSPRICARIRLHSLYGELRPVGSPAPDHRRSSRRIGSSSISSLLYSGGLLRADGRPGNRCMGGLGELGFAPCHGHAIPKQGGDQRRQPIPLSCRLRRRVGSCRSRTALLAPMHEDDSGG